ncbi:MAG: alpha/beta hydrolase [Acidobacteriota bacterium]
MKKTLKIAGWVLLAVLAVILLSVGYMQFFRPYTSAIKDERGRPAADGIASLEKVRLGGLDQWILVRGRSRTNPVVLFLHGGPGMPAMYLAHRFERPLEEKFVVVQWDQRGAGKSYSRDIPPQAMRFDNLIADTCELAERLKQRFHQDRIFLVGHSFGSYLGMVTVARHPELFHAFVGIGQLVEHDKSRELQDRFIRESAEARNEGKILAEFEARGDAIRESLIFRYGGELHHHTNMWPLLITGFLAPEYRFSDIMNIPRGVAFTHKYIDNPNRERPLLETVTSVSVPVYFFTGRHDYTTPAAMVEVYYRKIQAPRKRLVWFEESAHFPFFEEPEKFAREMERVRRETMDK